MSRALCDLRKQGSPRILPLLRCRAAMGRVGELLQRGTQRSLGFGGNTGACMGWRVSRCSGMISSDVIAVASPVKADASDST